MSVTTKQPQVSQNRGLRRLWKSPTSRARWFWLTMSVLFYLVILVWYYYAVRTQGDPEPFTDPWRLFGIFSYVLVLVTASYSLRRRFVRGLPGKVQNWLWMHTWLGVITILIALLHENYVYVTHEYCRNLSCLTQTYWAPGALFALIFLVVSGVTGRLLDVWQTRVIAREASSNGIGIERSIEEHLRTLKYTVGRYSAGKSDEFKRACAEALESQGRTIYPDSEVASHERADWKRVQPTLLEHARLERSLVRQKRARRIIQAWRTLHILLASIALAVISYHSIMELLTNVLHIIKITE
ncbi:hypothetical protein [Dictyobacter aurantiacus]|uniref:Uncharacterized protein n=1 Tax=Dictyobacter aurantiacus TaxID=1936993 RepID=A0A401ZDF6_9CHLR|nr:hypothetical protein [Dictyobacter aurantiacus]GCE04921.1 hypothetical protein KDAU_22500 [Dictyobacter aurantiacus]